MNSALNTIALLLCLVVPATCGADTPPQDVSKALRKLLSQHRGTVAAAYKHLETGESFTHKPDQKMPTASLIKLPIMAAAYHAAEAGELDLEKVVVLKEGDKVPGSGVLTANFSQGAAFSVRDAIRLMIAYSDNTATNLVIDQIGLPATTAYMKELGLVGTRLHSQVYRRDTSIDSAGSQKYGLGCTTASDMIKLVEMLHQGSLGTSESCDAMRKHLLACASTSKVPRYLPGQAKVAHKTGSVGASRCDAGIIYSPGGPIAFCVLTTDNVDRSWGDDNEGDLLAAEFGRIVYARFNKEADSKPPTVARVLKLGDDDLMVEALQRTLNARLNPSPKLLVDGDFGPNTQTAVIAFKKQKGLGGGSNVGPETWRALSPLLTEDDPTPEPEEVNNKPTPPRKKLALDGPPVVTCKAYAIADRETGNVLWGYNDSKQRDPASVTKIMTAYLVAELAEQAPAILDERITFSRAADNTTGSTSGVREGERVSVRDALYGLMLPSGNDMSVAFAEYFGDRFPEVPGNEEANSYDRFIQAMNAKAEALGMTSTGYKNPHGLTAKGHVTTASDMVKMGHAALQKPLLCEVASAPKYGCKLESVDGYERNVVWKNTNRLLGWQGFDGLKTGTTGRAGACLVSTGTRSGKGLIVVVLGATSGDARYVDSRNLYRWAWRELGVKE